MYWRLLQQHEDDCQPSQSSQIYCRLLQHEDGCQQSQSSQIYWRLLQQHEDVCQQYQSSPIYWRLLQQYEDVCQQSQSSQIYCRLLQQEEGCQPSLLPRLSAVIVHARQFSSGESNGSSVHPNSGTVVRVRAHSQTPSSSMSLPDSQNSERRRRELETNRRHHQIYLSKLIYFFGKESDRTHLNNKL